MGDSSMSDGNVISSDIQRVDLVTSSDGEVGGVPLRRKKGSEVKDIGYSSESPSNDETDIMRHQIDLEYKFPGKCEVASDGPLGDKVTIPTTKAKSGYYFMTHVDLDSTDKSDTTDSATEKMKKVNKFSCDLPESDKFDTAPVTDVYAALGDAASQCQESGLNVDPVKGHFGVKEVLSDKSSPFYLDKEDGITPMHEMIDFSESDSAPESKEKKSIRYLIEHAEDLVKPAAAVSSSPPPSSPGKQVKVASPSKQTQTMDSTVESSCDASCEDNSDLDKRLISTRDDTATDDASETLYNSVINLDSATESARNTSADDLSSCPKIPQIPLDSPRLRKQTGDRQKSRRGKDRPWSVVGLQDSTLNPAHPKFSQIASSESAINHIPCHTDFDSPDHISSSRSSTFPREIPPTRPTSDRRASSSDQTHTSPSDSSGKNSGKKSLNLSGDIASSSSKAADSSESGAIPSGDNLDFSCASVTSVKSQRRLRRRHRTSLEGQKSSDSYDSAEAESESETAGELSYFFYFSMLRRMQLNRIARIMLSHISCLDHFLLQCCIIFLYLRIG